jgi:hypothetical protein
MPIFTSALAAPLYVAHTPAALIHRNADFIPLLCPDVRIDSSVQKADPMVGEWRV